MSAGLDEKQPVTLIVSSNKIAAVEARLCIIVTLPFSLWRRISGVPAFIDPCPQLSAYDCFGSTPYLHKSEKNCPFIDWALIDSHGHRNVGCLSRRVSVLGPMLS